MTTEQQVMHHFEEWLNLLSQTNNMDLLDSPINVWVEAYQVGAIFERHRILVALQTVLQPPRLPEEFKGDISGMEQMVERIRKIVLSVIHQVPAASMASEPQAKQ